jgi:chemotaxis receptor (MCP) glutamine deamidase CheD
LTSFSFITRVISASIMIVTDYISVVWSSSIITTIIGTCVVIIIRDICVLTSIA